MSEADFHIVFNHHKDAVFRFAWRMTNSAEIAEDIAQDVFLSLLRHPDRFDPARGGIRSFLFGIARNLVLKRWRDESRREELTEEHFAAEPLRITDIARLETAEIVGQAVRSLPPLQREVLILAEYEGLSLEEIAQTVESEVGTVKSRLHRARENLRHLLAPLKQSNTVRSTSHGTIK